MPQNQENLNAAYVALRQAQGRLCVPQLKHNFSNWSHPTRVAFLLERPVTKEEVIAAIRACARKLGRIPTKKELRELAGISEKRVSNRFGSLGQAIREAGLEPSGPGYQLKVDALLKNWAAVARKLGKLPTKDEYTAHGRYSTVPFDGRWKSWRDVPGAFRTWTGEAGVESEWSDVLAMVEKKQPVIGS